MSAVWANDWTPPDPINTDTVYWPERPDWHAHAACNGTDPNLFFPTQGEAHDQAKAVCARCPVVDECLNHALIHRERFGIWGGLNERERFRKRRGRS